MNCSTIDIDQMLRRRGGKLLYEGPEGRVAQCPDGLILSDITSGKALCGCLSFLLLPEDAHFCVKSKDAADAVQERFHLRGQTPCAQWVYTKKDAPVVPGLEGADICPLPEEDVPTAAPHYHDSADYLRERSRAGELWGIYEEGKLAGFMGLHEEGSMGILSILPEFRRRGLASVLESWVIGQQLKQGQVPYGHVIEGNDASTALQESLGLTKAELPAIWVF